MCCEVDCHKELFNASHICEYFHHDRRAFGEPLGLLEQVIGSQLTQYQVVHLQKLTAEYLQKTTSILLHKTCNALRSNKQIYIANEMCGQMFELATKLGVFLTCCTLQCFTTEH